VKNTLKSIPLLIMLAFPAMLFAQQSAVTPPAEGQTATKALHQIQENVNKIQSLKATLEMDKKDKHDSKKDKKKKKSDGKADADAKAPGKYAGWEPEGRRVRRGPMEIQRGHGAWLSLQRKDSVEEYIANATTLWTYDHGDKEAHFIPTSMPVVTSFVDAAFKLNVFVALEPDSIKLKGTQTIDGEPCWVIEGKSPKKLEVAGIDQTKIRIYISQRDGVPREIRVPSIDDTVIRLKNILINTPINPSRYNWTPPPGVKTKNIFGF